MKWSTTFIIYVCKDILTSNPQMQWIGSVTNGHVRRSDYAKISGHSLARPDLPCSMNFCKNTCLHNAPGERMALEEPKQPLIKCIMAALNPPLESVDGYNYAPRRGFSWPPCPILTHFCSADDLRHLGFAIYLATYSHREKKLYKIVFCTKVLPEHL